MGRGIAGYKLFEEVHGKKWMMALIGGSGCNNIKDACKVVRNYIIIYLPEITYNADKYVYTYTL